MKIKIEIDTCRNEYAKYDTDYINIIVEKAIAEAIKASKGDDEAKYG